MQFEFLDGVTNFRVLQQLKQPNITNQILKSTNKNL